MTRISLTNEARRARPIEAGRKTRRLASPHVVADGRIKELVQDVLTESDRAERVSEQLEFDMHPLVLPERVEGATIQERFEEFHRLNPWVLRHLETLTRLEISNGRTRVGIGMLFEVTRWHYGRIADGDDFKLNNNYRSRYVRLMIDRNPDWASLFETRKLTTA